MGRILVGPLQHFDPPKSRSLRASARVKCFNPPHTQNSGHFRKGKFEQIRVWVSEAANQDYPNEVGLNCLLSAMPCLDYHSSKVT